MESLKDKERKIHSWVWETIGIKNKDSNTEDEEVFLSKDVSKAVDNIDDKFIELVGKINGLPLVNKFNQKEVNILLGEFQNQVFGILGDFGEKEE